MLKGFKPINFEGKNIFTAMFTLICLYLIQIFTIALLNIWFGAGYLSVNIAQLLIISGIFIFRHKDLIKQFKNIKKDSKGKLKNIILITIGLLLIEFIVSYILIKIIGHQPDNNNVILSEFNALTFTMFILNALLIAPTAEALIYFYPFHNIDNKRIKFITITIIFALFHIVTTAALIDLLFIIPYLIISVAVLYGYYKTDNIYFAIFSHMFNNILAVINLLIVFYR